MGGRLALVSKVAGGFRACGAVFVLATVALVSVPWASALTPRPSGPLPAGAVEIASVSNGCGGGKYDVVVTAMNLVGNSSVYLNSANPLGHRYIVFFKAACDLHDAGYTGAKVWDSINGGWYDFFGLTKKQVDRKFLDDMRKLCEEQIPASASVALADCKGRGGITSFGAESRFNFVRDHGEGYRERPRLDGQWRDPVECRLPAFTVYQEGRALLATWKRLA